jgi:hypothetical protein
MAIAAIGGGSTVCRRVPVHADQRGSRFRRRSKPPRRDRVIATRDLGNRISRCWRARARRHDRCNAADPTTR